MRFNVNKYVRVRLTDYGRQIHRENFDRLNVFSRGALGEYTPPEEDENGWSEWQMWCLMGEFGRALKTPTANIPFESEIELVEDRA